MLLLRTLCFFILSFIICTSALSLPSPLKVVYINARDVNWNNPSAIVVSAINDGYNVIIITLWRSTGAVDLGLAWSQLSQSVQKSVQAYAHSRGAILLISAGADETPYASVTGDNYGQAVAQFALANNLDGVDLDMEGLAEGFTFGSMSAAQCITWLADASNTAKRVLGTGHFVSHAPQAPYFGKIGSSSPNPFNGNSGGYSAVYKYASSGIDFLNVQFYDQGTACSYNTYTTLFEQSGAGNVCQFAPGTSIKEIASYGIPLSKLVVGKYLETYDASNGYVTAAQLASYVRQAKQRFGWNTGVMCWQFSLADSPAWIATIYPNATDEFIDEVPLA